MTMDNGSEAALPAEPERDAEALRRTLMEQLADDGGFVRLGLPGNELEEEEARTP